MSWGTWAEQEAERIRAEDRWRTCRTLDTADAVTGRLGTQEVVCFASNDYLGLGSHPLVVEAAADALARWGAGSGSSRLISGTRPVHEALEHALARWKSAPAAVLFPTGYMANLAAMATFAGPEVTVLSDALNHASIIDGCRLARAAVAVYPHLDLDALEAGLRGTRRAIVVTESVFSMDGDAASVADLVCLADRYGALLVIDEAHAVWGPDVPSQEFVLRVGTLSKALGSVGGFIAGPARLLDLVVNRARPFIFTTAPAPATSAAALAAVQLMQGEVGAQRCGRLRALVDRVRCDHPSPIVPLLVGDEGDALALSRRLLDRGLLIPAIRPPTVPPGTSRLRISLSAAHADEHVDALLAALPQLRGTVDAP